MKLKKSIPLLPVQDIAVATAFYHEKFGFETRYQELDFAIIVRDDVEIHLWRAGDESWRTRGAGMVMLPICSGAESFLAGTASCRIEVQEIDQLYEELRAKGVLHSSNTVVTEQPWGDKDFAALDLHRNLLIFYEVF